MSDKSETPSREISGRMKKLRLQTDNFRKNFDKEFTALKDLKHEDSFNSSIDSDSGSPWLTTRMSMCLDERTGDIEKSAVLLFQKSA
jgi:hypothetical protein